jgi:hypothetical protein
MAPNSLSLLGERDAAIPDGLVEFVERIEVTIGEGLVAGCSSGLCGG